MESDLYTPLILHQLFCEFYECACVCTCVHMWGCLHVHVRVSTHVYVCTCVLLVSCCRCRSLRTLRRTSTGTSSSGWSARRLTCEWTWRLRATPSRVSSRVKIPLLATNSWCQQRPSMRSTLAGYLSDISHIVDSLWISDLLQAVKHHWRSQQCFPVGAVRLSLSQQQSLTLIKSNHSLLSRSKVQVVRTNTNKNTDEIGMGIRLQSTCEYPSVNTNNTTVVNTITCLNNQDY